MSSDGEPTGSIDVALEHAARLMAGSPLLALEQAREILKVAPGHPVAQLLLGRAQRATGDLDGALRTFKDLVDSQHRWAAAHFEWGQALTESAQHAAALTALRRAVELKPDLPDAWRSLGDLLTIQGDGAGADVAYAQQLKLSTKDPRLQAAAAALLENKIPNAEALLRTHLLQHPTDIAALRMLAEVASRLGRYGGCRKAPAALP